MGILLSIKIDTNTKNNITPTSRRRIFKASSLFNISSKNYIKIIANAYFKTLYIILNKLIKKYSYNYYKTLLVGVAGFEPATRRLRVGCSTT